MKRILLFVFFIQLVLGFYAFAQGMPAKNSVSQPESAASFDKRLPPVIPGEEIKDGDKTIKVWSSSGPVPVEQAPEPWKKNRELRDDLRGAGVIIDTRKDQIPNALPAE